MLISSKSDAQKYAEARIMRDFKGDPNNPAHRESAEATASSVAEQNREIEKEGERYSR
jgi:hypothetical protein